MELLPLTQVDAASTPVKAGEFSHWLSVIQAAVQDNAATDVPCNSCNACCKSSYFIRIHRSETQAIANIPAPLLFPAPGDADVMVMGFDERGHCPMLIDDQCSIYSNRPNTCRTYDCRLFAGCGITPEETHAAVAQKSQRWQFAYADQAARTAHQALLTAAAFLQSHHTALSVDPNNRLQLAITALRCQPMFLSNPLPDAATLLSQIQQLLNQD